MISRRFHFIALVASAATLTVVLAGCGKDSRDAGSTTTPPATTISKPANAPGGLPPTGKPASTPNQQPK